MDHILKLDKTQIMKRTIIYISTLFLLSCTYTVNSNTDSQIESNQVDFQKKASEFVTKHISTFNIFKFENNEFIQIIAIQYIDENTIKFILKIISKSDENESNLTGNAKIKVGDSEIDEDEEGIGYPVNEYVYDGECWISIRIALQTKDMLRIISSDCGKLSSKYAPFDSKGILKKIN